MDSSAEKPRQRVLAAVTRCGNIPTILLVAVHPSFTLLRMACCMQRAVLERALFERAAAASFSSIFEEPRLLHF